jgi:peptidoglycan/LPS O-acetylase OafA/YrhL
MNHQIRFQQLDALRGLAALTVVFSHFTLLAPLLGLRHTPLRVLSGGHEAVILFFVLSGFVLTLQINGERKLSYGEYAIRRVCRIYLPYLGAVAFAYICYTLTYSGAVNWAGPWFNGGWLPALANADLLWHVLFVFPFETDRLDPIIWSLVYEMRISLVFMPVLFAVFLVKTWQALAIAALASLGVCAVAVHTNHPVIQASVSAEWLPTLHYLLMFVAGAALAKHRSDLSAWLAQRRAAARIGAAVLLGSLALYVMSRPISLIVHSSVLGDYLFDWIVLVAVCGIIACAIALAPFARLLQRPPLPFLGRISYSLYLYHAVVLFGVVHLVGERLGAMVSLVLAAALILPVSYLGYVLVERPSMRLGSYLARKVSARRLPAEATVQS